MPDILLFGLGAIGSTYAYIFQEGGANVSVVARSNYEALKTSGMNFISQTTLASNQNYKFNGGAFPSCSSALKAHPDGFDYIVCCSKALLGEKPALEDLIESAVTAKTVVMVVQNGVGAEAPLRSRFPNNIILTCVTWIGAGSTVPGEVTNTNLPIPCMQFGPPETKASTAGKTFDDEMKACRVLDSILTAGGADAEIKEDMMSERWRKVMWNAAWNPTTAVAQTNTKAFMAASPFNRALCSNLMTEIALVAQALGHDVSYDDVPKLMAKCEAAPNGLNSSMQADVAAGRMTEIECILGTPLREAKRLDLHVPNVEALYCCVKAIDQRNAALKK